MKVYKTYVCEHCGAKFSEETSALKNPEEACEHCEKNHAIPVSVSVEKHGYNKLTKYPSEVTVVFDNGAVCTYYSRE